MGSAVVGVLVRGEDGAGGVGAGSGDADGAGSLSRADGRLSVIGRGRDRNRRRGVRSFARGRCVFQVGARVARAFSNANAWGGRHGFGAGRGRCGPPPATPTLWRPLREVFWPTRPMLLRSDDSLRE